MASGLSTVYRAHCQIVGKSGIEKESVTSHSLPIRSVNVKTYLGNSFATQSVSPLSSFAITRIFVTVIEVVHVATGEAADVASIPKASVLSSLRDP